jgi:hypothetical protein
MLANTPSCPECGAALKLGRPPSPGKRLRCLRCRALFTVSEEDPPKASTRPAQRQDDAPRKRPIRPADEAFAGAPTAMRPLLIPYRHRPG